MYRDFFIPVICGVNRFPIFILLIALFLGGSLRAQEPQDSVVRIVFDALTAEKPNVTQPVKTELLYAQWEALAYWDSNTAKDLNNLSEAVGDLYTFKKDNTFQIRLIDPQDPRSLGIEINGVYRIEELKLVLTSEKNKEMTWNLFYLDKNYMILELDGLRIFFTRSKSYFTYD